MSSFGDWAFFFLWASYYLSKEHGQAAQHEAACCDNKSGDMVGNLDSCPGLTVTNICEDQDAGTMMKTDCMGTSK